MYVKTDEVVYIQDSTGTEIALGTASGITSLTGDVTGTGPGAAATTVASVGGSTATNIHSAELAANAATASNTTSTIVKRDSSGNFSAGTITASLNGNATTATIATSVSGSFSGDVTGNQSSTVVSTVGGSSAANIHLAELAANAATTLNTSSTIVKRDASGNFSAGTITANLSGNATTSTSFTGSLVGDVTGTQGATVVASVGGSSAANIHSAEQAANAATASNMASTIVERDASGNFAANIITATLSGTATNFSGSLSGDVTGTQSATAISATTVTGKALTGFVTGSNSPIVSTDTILQALEKTQGQLNATSSSAITSLTGDVTATGPGAASVVVVSVGGSTATNLHTAEQIINDSSSSSQYLRGDKTWQTLNTSAVPEGSNLYFTTARAQASVSATAPLVDTAGVFSIPKATSVTDGYLSATDFAAFTPAPSIEFHVNPGFSGTSTGTYNQPYTTIQAAVNAAKAAGNANSTIYIHGASTTENVVINDYNANLLIEAFGATVVDNQTFVLNGNITISGLSTRIRLKDFKVQYPGGSQPDLIDTSSGRNYHSNMGYEGGGGIQFSGSWSRWHEFTDCTVSGPVSIAGSPSSGSTVSFWRVRGGPNVTINASNAALQMYDAFNCGNITQTAGPVYIDGGRNWSSGATITSTTNNSSDLLLISNASLQTSTSSFVQINKTGTSPYILSNLIRNEAGDTLTGTRVFQGSTATDQKYLPTTPSNWPTIPGSVRDGLDYLAAQVSTITVLEGINRTIVVTSTSSTADSTAKMDYVYLVSGTTTITLPTAISNNNKYTVKNVGVNYVTVATTSGQTVDGSSTALLIPNVSVDIISDNSNWHVI